MTIKHTFVSAIPDDPASVAAGEVVPSNWNADHTITGTIPAANIGAAGSATQIQFNTANALNADADFVWNNSTNRLGLSLGSASSTHDISFGGNATRSIGLERNTTTNTAGNFLVIEAGGATVGSTNKNGGALYLSGGIATGTGDSDVLISGYYNGDLNYFMTLLGASRSVAWGINTIASGYASTAWGGSINGDTIGGTASGEAATAWGYLTIASGDQSTAWGGTPGTMGGTASGQAGTAWGLNTLASGQAGTAWGYSTTAGPDVYATAWGEGSIASGFAATAWGITSYFDAGAVTASGIGATAWGAGTLANADLSTVFGYNSVASANGATAWGGDGNAGFNGGTASAAASTAFGNNTVADGIYSTAWGRNTIASGAGSTAFGQSAQASGDYSLAIGFGEPSATIPIVYGNGSFGIFMGDQNGAEIDTSNVMVLLGGKLSVTDGDNAAYNPPASTIESGGSLGAGIATVNIGTTLDGSHFTVLVDASGGPITISLPPALSAFRRIYNIKKIDNSGNAVTITGAAGAPQETIDGSTTKSITTQYGCYTIQSDGTQWWII